MAGLGALVFACGAEDRPTGPSAVTGGAPSAGSGGTTGGVVGSGGATGGVIGSGGTTGGVANSGGMPAAGAGGVTGGAGAVSVAGNAGSGGTSGAGNGAFTLTSPAFESRAGCEVAAPAACDVFPDENVSYMERPNVSPELLWAGVPPGTKSFAMVLMDATYGQAHWALWNIPADATMLAANLPQDTMPASVPGSQQATSNFATHGGHGYFGPHVPCNVFEFQLFALSTPTFSPMDPESAVLVAIELHELKEPVLGYATLIGRSGDYGMTCVAP